MSYTKYKVEVFDELGAYVDSIDVQIPQVRKRINDADSFLELELPTPFDNVPNYATLNYQYKIYDNDEGTQIYSGYVYAVSGKVRGSESKTVVSLASYGGRLKKTALSGSGNTKSITRDGTYSADANSLDTNKSSDQMKWIINTYRFKNGDVSISNETEDATGLFGTTTYRAQSFTTGTDTEQNLVYGVQLLMNYNTGTRDVIRVRINEDNSGAPSGTTQATARILDLSNTTQQWVDVIFDEPVQLSASTTYWIVVNTGGSASGTNVFSWRRTTDSSNPYSGGLRSVSTNSGTSWTDDANNDHAFRIIYCDDSRVPINYSSTSIQDSGDTKDFVFTDLNCLAAMNYVVKYAPNDFYFYIDATNTVNFKRAGTSTSLLIDSMDSASGWTNGEKTTGITTNTSVKKQGSASVQFSLDGTGTSHHIYKDISSTDISAYSNIGPWVYIPTDSTVRNIQLQFSSDSDTNKAGWQVNSNLLKLGAWNWILPMVSLGVDPDTSTGTLDDTAVTRLRFYVNTIETNDTSTYNVDYWLAANLQIETATNKSNVTEFSYRESIDELVNRITFSNNATSSPILRFYENTDSITDYGLSEQTVIDGRVTSTTTADEIGENFLNKNSLPKKQLNNLVLIGIDKNVVRPGSLLKVNGFDESLGINNFYVVTEVIYDADTLAVSVAEVGKHDPEKASSVEEKLALLERAGSSTGDTPTKTNISGQ